ncbi:MAG TPA: class I SAM-dependent methyltransferase, partial [Microbacterium sp.]|nr:class I SAM-dependent methyltransferase [Microbacterium sp.]
MAVYTHGHHDSVLRSHNTRTVANSAAYLEPLLSADAHLLDVGAGPGTITVDFASRVGRVTATEINPEALSLSQALAAERGATNIDFSVEDVHALSFADDSFDIVHAHQVLQHVGDPVQALREMRRVTRPGGTVAVRDADYAGFIWFPLLPELDEWLRLYREAARANGGEP